MPTIKVGINPWLFKCSPEIIRFQKGKEESSPRVVSWFGSVVPLVPPLTWNANSHTVHKVVQFNWFSGGCQFLPELFVVRYTKIKVQSKSQLSGCAYLAEWFQYNHFLQLQVLKILHHLQHFLLCLITDCRKLQYR